MKVSVHSSLQGKVLVLGVGTNVKNHLKFDLPLLNNNQFRKIACEI